MASTGNTNTNTDILSDEIFDFICRVCVRKGKNCEAEKYCNECGDYYCLTCVKIHDEIPSLTGHTIIGKEEFPKEESTKNVSTSKSKTDVPTERCDRHSHHFIDMYCQNHDEVGCGTCIAMDHRLCKDIFYIPEYVENKRRITRSTDIEQKLKTVSDTLSDHIENFKREKERLLISREETLEVIKKFRKEINDRLDELENAIIADIADKYTSLVDSVDKGMVLFEENKDKISNSLAVLSKDTDSITQKFVTIKKSNFLASKSMDFIEENKIPIPFHSIDFAADKRILSLLQEINALGETTKQMQQVMTKNEDLPTEPTPSEDAILKTTQVQKYPVRVRTDRFECSILTACTMEDGTIILAEGRNNKIKRLNGSTFVLQDYCDTPGKPWQVCALDETHIAVTLPRKEKVLFVSVADRMIISGNISTGFNCHGLAYADGNLYISDRFTAIYVLDITGGKLQKFTKDIPRREMSYAIRSLAVLKDGSKVFVAGWNNGLIVLNNNGKVVGGFCGPQLDGAWDCHLTDRGSLLVSGNNSNNVLQFGLDGKLKGEVVKFTDQNRSYKGLCCNKQMTKMMIGKTGDEIEVYDLM